MAETITGTAGNDILNGSSLLDSVIDALNGDDTLTDSGGRNTFYGGNGNDTINGGTDIDSIAGGANDDLLYGNGGADLIFGGNDFDTLFGGAGDDMLSGGNEDDALYGGDSIDTLYGDAGNDALYGGDSDDSLSGGDGADYLFGEAGADTLAGGNGDDYFVLESDTADTLVELANQGTDTVSITNTSYTLASNIEILAAQGGFGLTLALGGNAGNNDISGIITFGFGFFSIDGFDGNDTLSGAALSDTLAGGTGNDVFMIHGDSSDVITENLNEGTDEVIATGIDYTLPAQIENLSVSADDGTTLTLAGNALNNTIKGISDAGVAHFNLYGYDGNDKLYGAVGNDWLYGGTGSDLLNGNDGNDSLDGSTGNDTLNGAAGNDILDGGEGNDLLNGGGLRDLLTGANGADTLYGGNSADTLDGSNGDDVLHGDAGNDALRGRAGNDSLEGGAGNDRLYAGDDNDTLLGGTGIDTLDGGAGADIFLFNLDFSSSGIDVVESFSTGSDQIHILQALTDIGTTGTLASMYFTIGTLATTTDQRFVFDDTTGNLYYDADGSGGGTQVQFATLSGGATLLASDIVIV